VGDLGHLLKGYARFLALRPAQWPQRLSVWHGEGASLVTPDLRHANRAQGAAKRCFAPLTVAYLPRDNGGPGAVTSAGRLRRIES
jgi:hypothetical protein